MLQNTTSYENRRESMFSENNFSAYKLDDMHLCSKDTMIHDYSPNQSYQQKMCDLFYTRQFERMLKENILNNSGWVSCDKYVKDTNENSFICSKSVGIKFPNIPSAKIAESYQINRQLNKPNLQPDVLKFNDCCKTSKKTDKVVDFSINQKYSSEMSNISNEDFEHQPDTVGENEIFKSRNLPDTDGVKISGCTIHDMPCLIQNSKEIEYEHNPENFKINESNSYFNKVRTCAVKNNESELTKLSNSIQLSNEILSMLHRECLLTGVTQIEVLAHLRKKEIPGTVDNLRKSISAFFNNSIKVGIIKRRNRRLYLNFVDDVMIRNNYQPVKRKIDCNCVISKFDFKKRHIGQIKKCESTSIERCLPNGKTKMLYKETNKAVPDEGIEKEQSYEEDLHVSNESNTENYTKLNAENSLNAGHKKIKRKTKLDNTDLKDQKIDLTKQTILNMMQLARSRQAGIKKNIRLNIEI